MFYIIVQSLSLRTQLLAHLKNHNINAVFHYVPLHTSPMGQQYGCKAGDLPVTEDLSERLIRLPCYYELNVAAQEQVMSCIHDFISQKGERR